MRFCLLSLFAVAFALACTKAPEKVVDPNRIDCQGKVNFRKDTTLALIDTLDNTYYNDDTIIDDEVCRVDIRITEKNGNILVLTLKDKNNLSAPTPGFYSAGINQLGTMNYYLKDYQSSGFLIDSVRINLINFNEGAGTCSGTFGARMIKAATKDTIRIRQGDFQNICLKKRNK